MASAAALGIDVGGTKMTACTITEDGEILNRQRLTSPANDPEGMVKLVDQIAHDMGPGLPVGVGLPGIVDRAGNFRYAPNFLREPFPFREKFEEATGVTVVVGNDATVALYAECKVGAAVGRQDVIMFTIGTGVGGGLLVQGQLLFGHAGFAGELGHVALRHGEVECGSPVPGSIECLCAGTAIGRIARERLKADSPATILEYSDDLTGKAVTLAAIDGDAFAQQVLTDVGRDLGKGIASVCNVVDPELVLIGGGAITTAAPWIMPAVSETLPPNLLGYPDREMPELAVAQLGDDAGMVGAGLLALDRERGLA